MFAIAKVSSGMHLCAIVLRAIAHKITVVYLHTGCGKAYHAARCDVIANQLRLFHKSEVMIGYRVASYRAVNKTV